MPRSKGAFTLVELLVSIAIFVIFLGIVSTSYVSIVRAQRQQNEVRKMYSDVRVFLDMFAQEVRLGAIDYDCYKPLDPASIIQNCPLTDVQINPITDGRTDVLALVSKDGQEKTIFKYDRSDTKKIMMQKYVYSRVTKAWEPATGYGDYVKLMSDAVSVDQLSFIVFPDVNPYSGDSAIYSDAAKQFQPRVTLLMKVKNAVSSSASFDMDFQTSISSRVYSR